MRLTLFLVITAQALDILTTHVGLAAGIPEGNPVLAPLGEPWMYVLKLGMVGGLTGFVFSFRSRYPKALGVLQLMMALTVAVALHNLGAILGLNW